MSIPKVKAGDLRTQEALRLMSRFAERTGLTSNRPQHRYLWTDAFAVCNFLGMARGTGDERQRELALRLVDQVHWTLGRHRPGDTRSGWLSGLNEREGAAHPTRGGLRIGKPLPERRADEPFDEEQEWERDGQYFHYLTKWMHALDQTSRSTRLARFNVWARELAETAFRTFTVRMDGRLRMVWKMSVDLTRPLVSSMGHHDALEGLVSCAQLQATATKFIATADAPRLDDALQGFAAMSQSGQWATADPLGLGGLLIEAFRVEQLLGRSAFLNEGLLYSLLSAALEGLPHYVQHGEFRQPASRRLAFRELGLCIGLHAVELMKLRLTTHRLSSEGEELGTLLSGFNDFLALGSDLESFWLAPEHQHSTTWAAHRDINEVMLATSLVPEGCLVLVDPTARF